MCSTYFSTEFDRRPASPPGTGTSTAPAMKVPAQGPTVPTWSLPHIPQAASEARHLTRATLNSWGISQDSVEQALLAVSELVTNAVEHALPPVALELGRTGDGDVLRIEVTDGGQSPQPDIWACTGGPEEHGRGNQIVDILATTHGTRTSEGETVWFAELPIAA